MKELYVVHRSITETQQREEGPSNTIPGNVIHDASVVRDFLMESHAKHSSAL